MVGLNTISENKDQPKEGIDYSRKAGNMLKKCKFIRNKHTRVDNVLLKGEGMLMSTNGSPLNTSKIKLNLTLPQSENSLM